MLNLILKRYIKTQQLQQHEILLFLDVQKKTEC